MLGEICLIIIGSRIIFTIALMIFPDSKLDFSINLDSHDLLLSTNMSTSVLNALWIELDLGMTKELNSKIK